MLSKRHPLEWPGSDERLVKKVFLVGIGDADIFPFEAQRSVKPVPSAHRPLPGVGHFREYVNSRAHILAALGVMRRSGGQRVRPFMEPALVASMKGFDRDATRGWIAADFVQRSERIKPVERGVFESFRHHRAGELLDAQSKVEPFRAPGFVQALGMIQQQHRRKEVEGEFAERGVSALGGIDRGHYVAAILAAHRTFEGYVRAINRKAGNYFGQHSAEAAEPD